MAKIAERSDNHAKCNQCGKYKEHIDSGVINANGMLTFIADRGTPWKLVGRTKTCPDCVDAALVAAGKSPQAVLKDLLKFDGKPRSCVDCTRVLPTRRGRICEFCRPDLDVMEVDEDFIYSELGD